jgi:hypothetical protein
MACNYHIFHKNCVKTFNLLFTSWLLYAEVDYNQGDFNRPSFYAWGENYCTNFDEKFDDIVS